MKYLFTFLLFSLTLTSFSQTSLEELFKASQTDKVAECKCNEELTFRTVKWSVSTRGNEYCIRVNRNGNITKEYKKYFTVSEPAAKEGYLWVQTKKGYNFGKWYYVKL